MREQRDDQGEQVSFFLQPEQRRAFPGRECAPAYLAALTLVFL